MITTDQAYAMGANGAEPTEAERLLFESWMRGHCWMVHGDWDGATYVDRSEKSGYLHPGAMLTRQLWAAWRDRAALAVPTQEHQINQLEKFKNHVLANADALGVVLDTATAQRQWVGLTGQQKNLIARISVDVFDAIHRTEAKLKEKNA